MLATAEIASSQDSLPVCLWKENPNGLVSLWDILERYAFSFYEVACQLEALREQARISKSGHSKVWDHHLKELLECLPKMRAECESLSLEHTSGLISRLEDEAGQKGESYEYLEMFNDLDTLKFSFSTSLRKRVALLLNDDNKKYFQKDDLFGANVNNAFPSCLAEIRDAGNCYALEQYEATAFHSMRVLERGLNALAIKFGVDFSHTNWHNVIEEIEKGIRKINSSFGTDWKEQQKFCSQAASQFMFLKDAWRNHIMHVRAVPYDPGTASSVLGHVRQIMQALADGGLKE